MQFPHECPTQRIKHTLESTSNPGAKAVSTENTLGWVPQLLRGWRTHLHLSSCFQCDPSWWLSWAPQSQSVLRRRHGAPGHTHPGDPALGGSITQRAQLTGVLSPLWVLTVPLVNWLVSLLAWSLSFSESSLLLPPNSKGKKYSLYRLSLWKHSSILWEFPSTFQNQSALILSNKELLEQAVEKFQLHLLGEYQHIICLDCDVCVCVDIYLFGCAGS